jgi:hypothetical protein
MSQFNLQQYPQNSPVREGQMLVPWDALGNANAHYGEVNGDVSYAVHTF